MTSERSQAYGRVMSTLEQLGPSKLLPAEQEQIRETADNLFFCEDISQEPDARAALDGAAELVRRLIESERWLDTTATQLLLDLEACGPLTPVA